jgi:hypothetical protein
VESSAVRAIWMDSWHMRDDFMICEGKVDSNGLVVVKGTYGAPPGPDWGWQITIESIVKKRLVSFFMDSISPNGEEMLAVEIIYKKPLG